MVLLSHDAFLTALRALFAAQASSSVFLTHKRVAPRAGAGACVLYRATNGKGRRASTRVSADDAAGFHEQLMHIVKGSCLALKKVEKSKEQRAQEKAAKLARGAATAPVVADLD